MSSANNVRVRFAPSPTGALHIGGVRTALYNYLFARKNGGSFLLRIEDTDQKRYVEGAEQYIINALEWCGITPDEGPVQGGDFGPYRQSERKEIYGKYAQQLLDSGNAYYAFDTEEELTAWREKVEAETGQPPRYDHKWRMQMRNSLTLPEDEAKALVDAGENWVLRFKIPADETVTFEDTIRGAVTFSTNELDDKVILKADGMPTYHLANVVDDHLMKITHVIRGEEWISSGPLHVLLYRSLGWEATRPQFAHLPLILNPNGKGKLSKRMGDKMGFPIFPLDWMNPETEVTSKGYDSQGFLPAAFVNFLVMIGWNPGTEQEVFDLAALEQAFSIERVVKGGARFDFEKAKWFNEQHLRSLGNDELAVLATPVMEAAGLSASAEKMTAICSLMKERITFINELPEKAAYFFGPPTSYDQKAIRKKFKPELSPKFEALMEQMRALESFDASSVEGAVKGFMEANELGFGQVLPTLRLALAGTLSGPGVFEMMEVLGKEETIGRMRQALDTFPAMKESSQA